MPIVVRHDVPVAASAGLAALAGTVQAQIKGREEGNIRERLAMQLRAQAQRQAQQLDAAARQQHKSIQARAAGQQQQIEAASAQAHQQAEYAKDQLGLRAGLQEELQDQKFSQEIERMELQARTQAEQFEWTMDITAQKRQNQVRRELAWLQSPEAREHYEEDEIAFMVGEANRSLRNPNKTPSVKKPEWGDNLTDGQGNQVQPMERFKTIDGGYAHYELSARGTPTLKHDLKPNETMEYLEIKAEQEVAIKLAEVDQKRREYAGKLMEKPVPVMEDGEDTGKTRNDPC